MEDGLAGLVVPGTPLLLPGIDPGEPERMTRLRERILALLRGSSAWVLPVAGRQVPRILSLGGLGLPIGVRVHGTGACGRADRDALRSGDALARAVDGLEDAEAARAGRAAPGSAVAAVLALRAGAQVHLHAAGGDADCPAAGAAPLLLPVDFSAAAHPDAPLAPRAGADSFDDQLLEALTGVIDGVAVASLVETADQFAAWLEPLGLADPAGFTGTVEAQEDLHHVRYAVVRLQGEGRA